MSRTLTCRDFIEFLDAYLEEELPADEREVFESHLSICPWCVDYLASYRETIRLGKAAFTDPDGPPPADAPPELVRAILEALPARR